MPRISWPAGSPFDAAICHYCKAPIVRGQLEHTCGTEEVMSAESSPRTGETGPTSATSGSEAPAVRLAARQAEMVAEVEKRLAANPGSDEAKALGCLCPRMDNGYGRAGPPWWITEGCPIHNF